MCRSYHIGFTGTRKGMTREQKAAVGRLIHDNIELPILLHHGDCVGADAEASGITKGQGARTCVHPPTNLSRRAFLDADVEMPEKGYIERNHDIVDASDRVVAAPGEMHEVVRSGTWATIRYAVKSGKPVIIIFPDGSTETR